MVKNKVVVLLYLNDIFQTPLLPRYVADLSILLHIKTLKGASRALWWICTVRKTQKSPLTAIWLQVLWFNLLLYDMYWAVGAWWCLVPIIYFTIIFISLPLFQINLNFWFRRKETEKVFLKIFQKYFLSNDDSVNNISYYF